MERVKVLIFLGGSKFTSNSNNSTANLRYLTTDGYDYNFQDIKKR